MSNGNIVYQGAAIESPDYFQAMGVSFPPFVNPADIFMKVLSINSGKKHEEHN
jgi:hypothetical protein